MLNNAAVDKQAVKESVMRWLSLLGNREWLLIIDNIDGEYVGVGKDEQSFNPKEALPEADHGSVLITSRLANVKDIGESLRLGHVSNREARAIIEHRAGRSINGRCFTAPKLGGLVLQ